MTKILLCAAFALAATRASAEVTFFEGPGFAGQPLTVHGGIADFRAYDYNDRAMSLIVEGAPVEVCEHVNFGGNCQIFNPGQYPRLGPWTHTISSVRPAYVPHRHYRHSQYYRGPDQTAYRFDGYSDWNWERERRAERRYRYDEY